MRARMPLSAFRVRADKSPAQGLYLDHCRATTTASSCPRRSAGRPAAALARGQLAFPDRPALAASFVGALPGLPLAFGLERGIGHHQSQPKPCARAPPSPLNSARNPTSMIPSSQ